jgi:hypothetical protein
VERILIPADPADAHRRHLAACTIAGAEVIRDVLHREWHDCLRLASLMTEEELDELEHVAHRQNAAVAVSAVIYRAQIATGDPARAADSRLHAAVIDATSAVYHPESVPSRQGPREHPEPAATEPGDECDE